MSRTDRSRWALALLGCLLVIVGGLGMTWRSRRALALRAMTNTATIRHKAITDRTARWVRTLDPSALAGVVFGGSVLGRPLDNPMFVATLANELGNKAHPANVLDMTYLGLDAFQFYYALSPVLAGRPAFAVVEVNLRTFAPDWFAARGLHDTHLAADLSLRQSLRARDALAAQGLSVLAPLTYRSEKAAGMLFLFDGLRLVSVDQLDALGMKVNDLLGLQTRSSRENFARLLAPFDARTIEAWYGRDFAASPQAEILRALRAETIAANVVLQFVVAPINTTRAVELGFAPGDLERRIELLREAIGATPEEWMEVSYLFSPREFMDSVHIKTDALARLGRLVSTRLSRRLAGAPPDDSIERERNFL